MNIIELKKNIIIPKKKPSPDWLNSAIDIIEDRIKEIEERTIEITQNNREKNGQNEFSTANDDSE